MGPEKKVPSYTGTRTVTSTGFCRGRSLPPLDHRPTRCLSVGRTPILWLAYREAKCIIVNEWVLPQKFLKKCVYVYVDKYINNIFTTKCWDSGKFCLLNAFAAVEALIKAEIRKLLQHIPLTLTQFAAPKRLKIRKMEIMWISNLANAIMNWRGWAPEGF